MNNVLVYRTRFFAGWTGHSINAGTVQSIKEDVVKKVLMKSALAAVASIGLVASSAMAIGFNFTGGEFEIKDSNGTKFLDQISFYGSVLLQNEKPFADAYVGQYTYDNYLSNGSFKGGYVVISDLYFNESNPFKFSPSPTIGGYQFALYDYDSNQLLFNAKLTAVELIVNGATGTFNSELVLNLTDINKVVSDSQIANSFYSNQGATTLTLNFFNANLAELIKNTTGSVNDKILGTFSGSAAPIPEPGVTMLFSLGVLGFAGVVRKRKTFSI